MTTSDSAPAPADTPLAGLKQLLSTLVRAEACCSRCGTTHGQRRPGELPTWTGQCQVCLATDEIADTCYWGYLRPGVERLFASIRGDQ